MHISAFDVKAVASTCFQPGEGLSIGAFSMIVTTFWTIISSSNYRSPDKVESVVPRAGLYLVLVQQRGHHLAPLHLAASVHTHRRVLRGREHCRTWEIKFNSGIKFEVLWDAGIKIKI